MNDKDFTEILNNSKDLTIGQIFKLARGLKYKTIILFVATFLAITGSAFVSGQVSMKREAAVMMNSPFSMRIIIDDNERDFENLTLIKDPALSSPAKGTILLSMREIQSVFDIVPIGQIVAKIDDDSIPLVWQILFTRVDADIVGHAHAQPMQPGFDWNGHAADYSFNERHVSKNIIHRHYSDGCILEYHVDKSRRSIPNSFRWMQKTH